MKMTQIPEMMMALVTRIANTLSMTDVCITLVCLAAIAIVMDIMTKNERVRKAVSDLFLMGIVLWICSLYKPEYVQLLCEIFIGVTVISVCAKRIAETMNSIVHIFRNQLEFLGKFLKNLLGAYVELFKVVTRKIQKWYFVKRGCYRCDNEVLRATNVVPFKSEK